jgi:hypothetical protein
MSTLRKTLLRGLAIASAALFATAAEPPRPLPPRTFEVGRGGNDGFLAAAANGTLHIVQGDKYRSGPAPDRLGPEERFTDIAPVNGIRIAIDGSHRPHVVFTAGATDNATRSFYTTRRAEGWLPAEKFADIADFPERTRAYVADVAVDADGHALVCFWVSRPTAKRNEWENASFHYRWRTPAGVWSPPRSLASSWSSAPKVEFAPGRGFLLLWQHGGNDWRIAGPVPAGGTFTVEQSTPTGSLALGAGVQNEGANFSVHARDIVVVAGNKREKFEGPVGVWASTGELGRLPPALYLGSFPGTLRGNESGLHPTTTIDAETGDAFVAVLDAATKRAVFTVHRTDGGWVKGYTPILPDAPVPQGTLRQGPALADLPGPGVVALVRDGERRWRLRVLTAADVTVASGP